MKFLLSLNFRQQIYLLGQIGKETILPLPYKSGAPSRFDDALLECSLELWSILRVILVLQGAVGKEVILSLPPRSKGALIFQGSIAPKLLLL